jgi:hypothetical protein
MCDPVDQRLTVRGFARVRHFHHEESHLPGIVEWRPHLELAGLFRPDPVREVARARHPPGREDLNAGKRNVARPGPPEETESVALVRIIEVSDPNNRRRKKSATSIGAALRLSSCWARPVRSTQ